MTRGSVARVRRATLWLLLAVAFAAAAPPVALGADWLPIETVGTFSSRNPSGVTLAGNGRGDAVALWRDERGLQVAVARRGAPFAKARRVPGSSPTSPGDVAVMGAVLNEGGKALIQWVARGRVYVAGLDVDGGFGRTRAVTPASGLGRFSSAIGPRGRFAIAYTDGPSNKRLYARSAPPSGDLGPPIRIAANATAHAVWYAGTRPYVAYTQPSEEHRMLRERRIGARGRSRVIANLPKNAGIHVDTASNGVQAAVWSSGDGHGTKEPLLAAVRRPGGVFQPQQLDFRVQPQVLDVAVAPSGAALVGWAEWNEATTEDGESDTPEYWPSGRIVTAYRSPGGAFGEPRAFRPDSEPALIEFLEMDINSRGQAALTWEGTRFYGIQHRLFAAVQARGEQPHVRPLTELDEPPGRRTEGGSIAIDEQSRTAVDWTTGKRIRAMRGRFQR
ncbi:MAG TPA: hypothetical protein VF520_00230 [Thermoleophilaceae bacterium]|jgi:hypothetical protein